MVGQIVRVIAGFYDIDCNGVEYRTRGAGNLRLGELSPVVGDIVDFEKDGFITRIHERRNSLVRPKVANIDQAIIVISLKEPDYSSYLLNKFLAIVEYNNIDPVIVFTKRDLVTSSPKEEYEKQGYKVFEVSNKNPETTKILEPIFKDKLSVFTGQTGAGKSSTIQSLTNVERETQEISKSLGRGKHTTRVVEIVPWHGGKLIDTPGFSSLELNLTKEELARSFKDFKKFADTCKFKNCVHKHENVCGVKDAVEKGLISQARYNDYLKMLEEAK